MGQAVWITGAGTGFGQALTACLAAARAQVFLSGRREAKLRETVAHLQELQIPAQLCTVVPCDITDEASVDAAMAAIRRATPYLYGLINNAALPAPPASSAPLASLGPSAWRTLIETNVTGQWLVTRAALPLLTAGPAARVLFITSEAGWAFTPGFGPYNVSKAALNNLGASFAAECREAYPSRDIQMNVLVPGEARTEMNQGSTASPYTLAHMALALLSHPPGGPTGCFFHRDGRHLPFAYAPPYGRAVI